MASYKLKEGVVIHPFGKQTSITNENLTDSIAEYLLESGKATIEDFEPLEPATDGSNPDDQTNSKNNKKK